jgi:hypothetical protein
MPEHSCKPITLRVDPDAIASIGRLLRTSLHRAPILVIAWQGEGSSAEELTWRWLLKALDAEWKQHFMYVRFEAAGFEFHATHDDLDRIAAGLSRLSIVAGGNGPIVVGPPPESS